MVLVLTKSSNGDLAAAIFNAAAGNMIGVFLSPLLILGYLSVSGEVDLVDVFYKLALRVVLPVVIGQLIRKFIPPAVKFFENHKPGFKQAQQLALVFIVYTVFCETFQEGNKNVTGVDIIVMIIVEFLCLTVLMTLAWILLKLLFPNEPRLRVMGLYGCTHKTVAMGVPLINALYEHDSTIGLITLPLLTWQSMQLIMGSFLAPKLASWVNKEEIRLGIHQGGEDEENGGGGNDDEGEQPQEIAKVNDDRTREATVDDSAQVSSSSSVLSTEENNQHTNNTNSRLNVVEC
jgi:sodium/bile acid cotransporter 7